MRCHWPIASLPGVDEKLQQDLAALGITDTQRLLKVSAAKHVALAAELEQPLRQLKKIMALASLAQVPAVGCEYCGLLLHGGIASIEQLSSTRPQLPPLYFAAPCGLAPAPGSDPDGRSGAALGGAGQTDFTELGRTG
jgi:hypothetical protein